MKTFHLFLTAGLLSALAIPSFATPPLAGSTCASFATQQEAQYHFEHFTAPAQLDADGDGIACEELPVEPRTGGTRIFSNASTNGIRFSVYSVDNREWYLKVSGWGEAFTTRSFSSSQAAIDHGRCYYGNHCGN